MSDTDGDARRRELGDNSGPVEEEVEESFDRTVEEGAQRLNRSFRDVLITGLFGANINGAGDSHFQDPGFVKAAKDMHEARLLTEGGFTGSKWASLEQRYERAEKELFSPTRAWLDVWIFSPVKSIQGFHPPLNHRTSDSVGTPGTH